MRITGSLRIKGARRSLYLFFVFFSLFALFSALGLDFINWKNGKKSYFFSVLLEKKQLPHKQVSLSDSVLQNLSTLKISDDSIHHFLDSEGTSHLMVDIPEKEYGLLEFLLSEEFQRENFKILKKEEKQAREKTYLLWEVEGEKKQRLTILFSCQKESAGTNEIPKKKKVAIIIDDMGYSLRAINDVCSIKRPLTVAILPHTPLAEETAIIAHQNGLEVILHLPLESIDGLEENNDIKGIIKSHMGETEILKTLQDDLNQAPHITGVNSHMGSKITANESLMRIILEHLKRNNLFFIDSLTTPDSVAYELAQSLGLPSAHRDVFLDGEIDEDYIKGQLIQLFRLAQKKGKAVGICHPWEKTLMVLKENFFLIEHFDLEPVFASQIVQ